MAFGLIRARNLSSADINSADKHNARRYDKKENYPINVPFEKREDKFISVMYTADNELGYQGKEETTLGAVIDKRLKDNAVKGIKTNSNLAIEYVIGINDMKAWESYDFDGFVNNSREWLEDRHGKGSVVAVYTHLDESNPHAHIVVVPIEKKVVKWKNTKGSGESIENRLNTRDYTGGRDKLRLLQNDWFNHLTERYNGGKSFGLELYRGTLVENQLKEYVMQTNHEIGELRAELSQITNDIIKKELDLKIAKRMEYLRLNELKLKNEQDRRNNEKKDLWKLKGTKNNPDVFHNEIKPKNRL